MELLYDLELPEDGGRLRGWLAAGDLAEVFRKHVAQYCEEKTREAGSSAPLFFAVGDGNHSLATAKGCYEELKARPYTDPLTLQRARYALVELENIRDDAQEIEPIHRLLTGTDPAAVLRFLQETCGEENEQIPRGTPVAWQAGEKQGILDLRQDADVVPAGILQKGLDAWLSGAGDGAGAPRGRIDYIHGEDTLRSLAARPDAIGFVLPPFSSEDLFRSIVRGGVLPRKTFSIGQAQEKRYYMEAREL